MIGQKCDLPVLVLVSCHHLAQDMRASYLGIAAVEPDQFIGEEISVGRDTSFFDNGVIGVVLQTGNKEDPVFRPIGKQLVIIIAPVHGDNRIRRKWDFAGDGGIVFLTI